jgi:hypothetical protein
VDNVSVFLNKRGKIINISELIPFLAIGAL